MIRLKLTSRLWIRGKGHIERDCGRIIIDPSKNNEDNFVLIGVPENLLPITYRLLADDFDESVGFPPVRCQAKWATYEAVDFARQYLANLCLILAFDT